MALQIALASDHAGFRLKEAIRSHLMEEGFAVEDLGVHRPDPADYPDQAVLVAEAVAGGAFARGILVCGTGVGMSISANKIRGVRAVVCSDAFSARMARAHNDCNVLCLGERVVGQGLAMELVDVFLATDFLGERHAARVAKIMALQDRKPVSAPAAETRVGRGDS